METSSALRLKLGSVEVEIVGDAKFLELSLDRLEGVLHALEIHQASFDHPHSETSHSSSHGIQGEQQGDKSSSQTGLIPPKSKSLVEFLKEKGPKTQVDALACIVYFRENYQGLSTFTLKEIVDYWSMSKQPAPGNMSQVISSAVSKTLITPLGQENPISYHLTSTGEEYVKNLEKGQDPGEVKPRQRKSVPAGKKAVLGDAVKAIMEAPFSQDMLSKYPNIDEVQSVIRKACWVLLVAKNEFGITELTASEIAQILTQKFRIKHAQGAIATALIRNPKTWNRVGNGKYQLMKAGEDLVFDKDGTAAD